jgi:hypothetical protein
MAKSARISERPVFLMADEEHYITSIPGEPKEFFMFEGYPCLTYEENGERKAARFEPPDRFYPMDPWILDWGDIAGLAYPQPISEFSFGLRVQLYRQGYEEQKKAEAKGKGKRDKKSASGAD